MKKTFTILIAAIAAILMMAQPGKAVGQTRTDDSYTITFANSANSVQGISSSTNASTVIANDGSRNYVTTQPFTINSGNSYYGDSKDCIRIGRQSNSASITIALSNTGKVKATSIVVNCKLYNSSDASTLTVNSLTGQSVPSSAGNVTFTYDSATDIESITLAVTKKIFVYSITVNYTTGGSTPTIAFTGTTSHNALYTGTVNQTFTGTYSNLGNNPTFSVAFYATSAANTDPLTGDDIPTWLTVSAYNNNGALGGQITVNANNGSERHAYFKVYSGTTYSSNVYTVNQAAAPTLYTVTFSLNEGIFVPNATFTTNPMSLEAGDYTLPSATKDGYLFVSWKDGNDNREYYAGAEYTLGTNNVTLTAQWEALDYNNTYTSGDGLLSTTGGTSVSNVKVKIYNVEYDGIKAGVSGTPGVWKVTVPINTTKLHLHFAGWSSDNVTLTVSPSGYSNNISLTKNSGISGSSTTYPWGTTNTDKAPSSDDHHKVITFENPLEEAVTLTFTATGGNRFVVWGVNAEMSTDPYITAEDVDIDDDATAGSITYTVHNIPEPAGILSASVKTGDWLTLGSVSSNVPFTCAVNPNPTERTATVTLTYTYGDSKTTTLDVTVTQAPKVVTYTYTLATSIESGRHYILVGYNESTPYAMGAQNNNVRNAIAITDEGDDVVSFTSDKGVREIVINGPEIITKNDKPVEVYTLYDAAASGYVYASSNTSNNIGTRPYNSGADSQWKIVFDEENSNFVVTAQGTNSRNILKYNYNSGNPRFSCYGSNTTLETLLYLYVKNEVTPQYDFYKDITAATNWSTASNGWYFIASPVNGNIDPEDVDNMLTADDNESHTYDLYRLSGNTLENFRNENTYDFVIANGTGYLYANKNNTTLKFSGSSVKTYSTDDNTVNPSHSGWNLIGNPYTFPVKVSRAFSELNNGPAVTSKDENSVINPGAGIIVYGTEPVTFTKYVPGEQSSGPSNINIMLVQQVASRDGSSTTSVAIDNAVVSFNSNSRLPKFTLLEGNAKLYIPQNGEDFAIAFSNRQGDMPLNFKTTETGNYTISFEGNNMNLRGIYLIDMLAGQEIDLSVNPSYTFIGSPVDKAERFKIVFKNVGNNGEDIFAYQNGNDIIVSGEGELQIFDVTGRSVMTTTISGVETINVPTMGVYIFRLIGSEIKTQKIVVR